MFIHKRWKVSITDQVQHLWHSLFGKYFCESNISNFKRLLHINIGLVGHQRLVINLIILIPGKKMSNCVLSKLLVIHINLY